MKHIGKQAFYSCNSLKKIIIPKAVISIETGAFARCAKLKKAVFLNTMEVLPGEVFMYCTNLKEVKLPKNLVSIERGAFYQCENLMKLALPNTVKSIEARTFVGCPKLDLVIPDSVLYIQSEDF